MRNWKKWITLPVWAMFLLTVVSAAALIWVFVEGLDAHPVAYVVYVVSFYTLTVDCFGAVRIIPHWFRGGKKRFTESKFGSRYLTDMNFKTNVSLYLSLLINFFYVAVDLLSVWLYRSIWFAILAFYYSILAIMRFLLARYVGKQTLGEELILELKRSRACAYILLLLNLVLSGAVLMIMYQNRGFQYHGIMIYVMAMYTFYVTINAVVSIVRYRKFNSPVMSTTKIISLCAALVSMLSLETAMFSQFGAEMSVKDQRIMIAATGGGISVVVVGLSILLIVNANKGIRREKDGR